MFPAGWEKRNGNLDNNQEKITTDSITIFPKEYILRVYIPTAFTLNNNGKNDFFKATVFGKVASFRLDVFDREGQLIFQTTDLIKCGTAGTKAKLSDSGIYMAMFLPT